MIATFVKAFLRRKGATRVVVLLEVKLVLLEIRFSLETN